MSDEIRRAHPDACHLAFLVRPLRFQPRRATMGFRRRHRSRAPSSCWHATLDDEARFIRLLCANFGLGVTGVAALFILHCHRVPDVLQPGQAKMGVAQGAAEAGAREREADDPARGFPGLVDDASGELGKKAPAEKWIPPEPFPEQARGPCKASLGEVAINGGCWFKSGDVKPPCGDLFRNGDSCYRPILKAPKQPLGSEPRQAAPEHQSQ